MKKITRILRQLSLESFNKVMLAGEASQGNFENFAFLTIKK